MSSNHASAPTSNTNGHSRNSSNINSSGANQTVAIISRPGAYAISPTTASSQVYRVTIPPNILPNQEFQVYAGNRIVRVRCPPQSRPGEMLQITVPVTSGAALSGSNPSGASYSGGNSLPMAVLTDAEGEFSDLTFVFLNGIRLVLGFGVIP